MTEMDAPTPPEQLGYRGAMRELDQILDELEADDVDVDLLATRVERAASLLRFCRERVNGARTEVERVVAELEPESEQLQLGEEES